MRNIPRPEDKSAPNNDWPVGRSRRGGCLMLTSVFLTFSSWEISIKGSTNGSNFLFCANFLRSSWEKLAQGTFSYLPSPTLTCTPASLAELASTSPVIVSPVVSLKVSARAVPATSTPANKQIIKQNLRTTTVSITNGLKQRKKNER